MTEQNTTWGLWTLSTSNWTLLHSSGYEVDLEEMTTSHEVLDWICHVSDKEGLFTREDVGYFVTALSELFSHLPSNFAHGKTVDVKALLKENLPIPDR